MKYVYLMMGLPKSPDRVYLDVLCRTVVEGMIGEK